VLIPSTLILLNVAIIATTAVVLFRSFRHWKLPAVRFLILVNLCFCWIAFCALNVFTIGDFELKVLFSRLRYLGLAPIAPCWLYFICVVYEKWSPIRNRTVLFALFVPTIITWTTVLVPELNSYIIAQSEPITVYGMSVVKFVTGPWFPIHRTFSSGLVIISLLLGVRVFATDRGIKRKQVMVLILGFAIAAIVDNYCVITDSPFRWLMTSSATFVFSQLAIVYAVSRHHLLDLNIFAQEKIFQDLPDPVLVEDHQGRIRAFNQAAATLLGLKVGDIGEPADSRLPHDPTSPTEMRILDRGEERFFALKLKDLPIENDERTGRIVFFRDITVQKRIEKRLSENLDFKARLLSLIAHDLSGNIKNQVMLSSVLEERTSPENRELIDLFVESSSASQDLMSNILSWSKTQEIHFQPMKRSFEIRALIQDCLETLEVSIRIKNIRISHSYLATPIMIDGDSEMVASALRNVLSNSIRFSPPGKTIQVRISHFSELVRVEIVDEGPGIAPEQLQELLSQTTAPTPSTLRYHRKSGYGIGLSIARKFIGLHGGDFGIQSTLGMGTSVYFTLPIGRVSTDAADFMETSV